MQSIKYHSYPAWLPSYRPTCTFIIFILTLIRFNHICKEQVQIQPFDNVVLIEINCQHLEIGSKRIVQHHFMGLELNNESLFSFPEETWFNVNTTIIGVPQLKQKSMRNIYNQQL